MSMVRIRPANENEISLLTAQSKAAFDTDVLVGATGAGGPPCYDDEKFHAKMLREGRLFTVLAGDAPVGGLILFRNEKDQSMLYVGRVFIAPEFFRMGYGVAAMQLAESAYPGIRALYLDTPIWNTRTNRFYTKLGYREARRDAEFIYYEKRLPAENA